MRGADTAVDGRERLLTEAHRLFLERGYAEVSIGEIAAAADMTRAAPYYHFRDKEDLFIHVFRREMERLTADLQARLGAAPTFRERLLTVVGLAGHDKPSFGQLVNEFERHVSPERGAAIRKECEPPTRVLHEVFERAEAEGELTRVDARTAYATFLALIIGQAELRKMEPGVAEIVGWTTMATPEQLVDIFLSGV